MYNIRDIITNECYNYSATVQVCIQTLHAVSLFPFLQKDFILPHVVLMTLPL